MTSVEKNTIIAEACGWKLKWQNVGGASLLDAKPTRHSWEVWIAPEKWWKAKLRNYVEGSGEDLYSDVCPPDYTSNLNACREMVESIKDPDQYGRELALIVLGYRGPKDNITMNYWSLYRIANASAQQRVDAFIAYLKLGLK